MLLRSWLNYQASLDLSFPICKLKRRIRCPPSSNSILQLNVNEKAAGFRNKGEGDILVTAPLLPCLPRKRYLEDPSSPDRDEIGLD